MTPQVEAQLRKKAEAKGLTPPRVEAFISFAKQRESPAPPAAEPKKEGGFSLKELAKDVARPFLRVGVSTFNATAGTMKALKGDIKGANAELDKERTVFGVKAKPLELKSNDQAKSGPAKFLPTAQSALDVAKTGAEIGLNATGGKAAATGTQQVVRQAGRAADDVARLVDDAAKAGRQSVDNLVSTIDEPTKSVLNPNRLVPEARVPKLNAGRVAKEADDTKALYDRYFKQAQRSATDMSKPSALDLAGSRADEALRALQGKLHRAGELKTTALKETGGKVVSKVSQVRQTLRRLSQERLGVKFTKDGIGDAAGRMSKVDATDHALLKRFDDMLASLGDDATVQKVDDVVDQIQDVLYRTRTNTAVQVNEKTAAVLKEVVGELNSKAKFLGGPTYRKANARYGSMVDAFEKLNKALGLDASKGGSLMKRVFSPTDGGTKRLFADIKRITGIDLTKEATLAKLAMDTVGDPRSRSLLEQLDLLKPTGALGLLEKAGKFALDRARNPEREARTLIQQAKNLGR